VEYIPIEVHPFRVKFSFSKKSLKKRSFGVYLPGFLGGKTVIKE
jgi:hypothetical protein